MDEGLVEIELNPREQRLYDRIRRLVIEPEPGASVGVRDLLLLLPDLVILLSRLLRDDRVSLVSKIIALAGLAYVVSPVDFVPALVFGPVGLVDDLLIVGLALSRLMNRVHPDVVRSHWPGKGDVLEAVGKLTGWAESQTLSRFRIGR